MIGTIKYALKPFLLKLIFILCEETSVLRFYDGRLLSLNFMMVFTFSSYELTLFTLCNNCLYMPKQQLVI